MCMRSRPRRISAAMAMSYDTMCRQQPHAIFISKTLWVRLQLVCGMHRSPAAWAACTSLTTSSCWAARAAKRACRSSTCAVTSWSPAALDTIDRQQQQQQREQQQQRVQEAKCEATQTERYIITRSCQTLNDQFDKSSRSTSSMFKVVTIWL